LVIPSAYEKRPKRGRVNIEQYTTVNADTEAPSMGARVHGQEGALAPFPRGNVVKCFVHCKTVSIRIIYALFSQPVVSF